MTKRLSFTAALLTLVGTLTACGGEPSIVGSWSSTNGTSASLDVQWAFKFTADNKFTLSLVSTNTATSGSGAGCANTVSLAGDYSVLAADLTVTAKSGTFVYEKCLNSAQNTPVTDFRAADLQMFSTDYTGPFTVTAGELTLNTPASGFGPGVLSRQ